MLDNHIVAELLELVDIIRGGLRAIRLADDLVEVRGQTEPALEAADAAYALLDRCLSG